MTGRRDDTHADDSSSPGRSTAGEPADRPRPARDAERPVLPDVSQDELDVGWGDEPGERDDEWYRRERPPHHG